jgi:hypothetical protein
MGGYREDKPYAMNEASPPPYPAAPPKKGLPPLAWAGIGCGGLILIALVAVAIFAVSVGKSVMKNFKEHPALPMVEAVLAAHPELDKPAYDEINGTITLVAKDTGKEVKTRFEDIVHGKVMIEDASGTPVPLFRGDLTKVPAWVPRYPASTGVASLVHQDLPDKIHGILVMETTDSIADVEKFFETEAGKLFTSSATSRSSVEINGVQRSKLSYAGGKKRIEILAYGKSGSLLTIMTLYTEEK